MRRASACHIAAQSSIACRCSGLRLAAHAIQQAKSTMASLPHVCPDPSQRLVSSIDLCNMQDVVPYDWSALFDKAIAHDENRVLVTSIRLLRDKHKIIAHPRNFTKWTREFVCPTCTQFRLIFTCSKPQTRLASNCRLLALQEPGHSAECPAASSCVDHVSVLANLPSLIFQMRSVELDPGRTFILVDVKSNLLSQQLSTSLKKSSVHRSLEAM
jgi:hypothetical protein